MVYTDPDEVPWSAYLAVAAIFAVLVAALLPWFVESGEAITGIERQDGYVTAGVSLAALGLLVAYEWEIVAQLGAALAGIVTIWAGYGIWSQVRSIDGSEPEVGLYLTLLGGAVLLGVAIYGVAETYWLRDDADGEVERLVK